MGTSENKTPAWTPGPWRAVRNNAYWEINPTGYGPGIPFTVGDCCASDPANPDGGIQEANAHLIAAAPELADFAARFEAAAGFLIAGLPTNHAVAKDLIGLREAARLALSRARGECDSKGGA